MKLLLLIALLSLACCTPRRVVVKDDDDLKRMTREAMRALEGAAGCPGGVWDGLSVKGRKRDWRGRYPPVGTVTVRFVDDLEGDWIGFAANRRIHIERPGGVAIIAHELMHAVGIDCWPADQHAEAGILAPRVGHGPVADMFAANPPHIVKQLEDLCR